jgi:hypothetical protein
MIAEASQPMVPSSATAQPRVGRASVPIWLILVLFFLLYSGMVYFDVHGGWFEPAVYTPYRSVAELETYQPLREGPNLGRGKAKFEEVCGL